MQPVPVTVNGPFQIALQTGLLGWPGRSVVVGVVKFVAIEDGAGGGDVAVIAYQHDWGRGLDHAGTLESHAQGEDGQHIPQDTAMTSQAAGGVQARTAHIVVNGEGHRQGIAAGVVSPIGRDTIEETVNIGQVEGGALAAIEQRVPGQVLACTIIRQPFDGHPQMNGLRIGATHVSTAQPTRRDRQRGSDGLIPRQRQVACVKAETRPGAKELQTRGIIGPVVVLQPQLAADVLRIIGQPGRLKVTRAFTGNRRAPGFNRQARYTIHLYHIGCYLHAVHAFDLQDRIHSRRDGRRVHGDLVRCEGVGNLLHYSGVAQKLHFGGDSGGWLRVLNVNPRLQIRTGRSHPGEGQVGRRNWLIGGQIAHAAAHRSLVHQTGYALLTGDPARALGNGRLCRSDVLACEDRAPIRR